MKRRIYKILEVSDGDLLSRIFDLFILCLIALNVLAFVLQSVRALHEAWGPFFSAFEIVSVAIFSVEYLLRIWSCTENPAYRTPILGRLRFILTPMALVDLIAIAPFFVAPSADLRFVRAIRIFRVLRLAKVARYSSAIDSLVRVMRARKEELITILSFVLLLPSSRPP